MLIALGVSYTSVTSLVVYIRALGTHKELLYALIPVYLGLLIWQLMHGLGFFLWYNNRTVSVFVALCLMYLYTMMDLIMYLHLSGGEGLARC